MARYKQPYRFLVLATLMVFASVLAGCALPGVKPNRPSGATSSTPGVVLLLPSQGNYASIARKIESGANIAVAELSRAGTPVALKILHSDQAWQQQLSSLPPSYAVVGGPLNTVDYQKVVQSNAFAKRAFFTFMGKLPHGHEGVRAWRFFSCAEDQMDALAGFVSSMSIPTVGALVPNTESGKRATDLFESKLQSRGLSLSRTLYEPGQPNTWKSIVAGIVAPTTGASGHAEPHTPYDAVFLPDSWRNMSGIQSAFAANGEVRLAMLGTMLWDGPLNGRPTPNAGLFPLAVFPSSFAKEMAPSAIGAGDFWVALGYDFVRFARRLNMTSTLTAQQVNTRARQAALMNFAMAPISYDANGRASQKLYLLQPGINGAILLDKTSFQSKRSAMHAMQKEQNSPSTQLYEGGETPSYSGTLPSSNSGRAASTYDMPSGTSSGVNKPAHTSYKLRLPGAK